MAAATAAASLPTGGSLIPQGGGTGGGTGGGGTGGGTGGGGQGGGGSADYLSPMSMDDITKTADTQVGNEIQAQIDPLTSQIGGLQGQLGGALAEIGGMFGSLEPYVQQEANAVTSSYNDSLQAEQGIFSAAQRQLNELRQQRAAEAQSLAQQMGGPVSVGEFTAAVEPDQSLLARTGATQMLHTLGWAQAGEQAAHTFAGQVFPVMRTEQEAQARSYYNNQIKQIQDQITSLQASKGPKEQEEINRLMQQERAYALQKAQADQAKLDSDRNYAVSKKTLADQEKAAERSWKVAVNTMKNDNKRTALAASDVTGKLGGKLTLAGKAAALAAKQEAFQEKHMTIQDKQQAQQLQLSNKEYILRKNALAKSTGYNLTRLAIANRTAASQYLDLALNPQVGKTVTNSIAVPVSSVAAISGKIKDAYKDPNSPTGYSRLVKQTSTPVSQPITDPNDLVRYLVAHNVSQALATRMVRTRLHLPSDWKFNNKQPPKPTSPQAPKGGGKAPKAPFRRPGPLGQGTQSPFDR